MKKNLKQKFKNSINSSLLIGLCVSFGHEIKKKGIISFSFETFLVIVVSFVIVSALEILFCLIEEKNENRIVKKEQVFLPNRLIKKSWLYGIICFVIILILWVPTFLALYPGLFVYDAPWQYSMYITNEVTAHHPVLHTYMLGGIIDKMWTVTGSVNKGAASYTLVQMVIMAAIEAYIMYLFHREKMHTAFHAFALIFYGLFPTCCIFATVMTKDSIFSVAFAALIVLTVISLKKPIAFLNRKTDLIAWVVLALIVLIFRNNAKYALVIIAPFFVVAMMRGIKKENAESTKKYNFRFLIMLFSVIVLFVIYDKPITKAITVKGISTAEMLSVPCQQLARVYNYRYDELSMEQVETIELLFGNDEGIKNYVPQQATNTKGIVDTELIKNNKGKYLVFWVKTGLEFPDEYINAFLVNTYAFWYPWPEYVVYKDGGKTYIPMYSIVPVEQNPKIKSLYNFYQEFATGTIVEGNNIISWLFSPAFYFYVYVLMFGCSIIQRRNYMYVPMACVGLLWLTYLLGPVAQVRYAIYFFYLFPCWLLINKREKKIEVNV